MINKDFFEGPVGDYCIARNTIKCLFNWSFQIMDTSPLQYTPVRWDK